MVEKIEMNTVFLTQNSHAIQGVVFDLDGVLMDSEWIAFRVWRDIAASHGGRLEERWFSAMSGETAEATAALVMRVTGITYNITEATALAWKMVRERLRVEIEPLPGSIELIHRLKDLGYGLAIASNSPADYIQNALTGLGVLNYFPVRVGINQVKQGKPAPEVYLLAAEQLGLDPQRCLAIEDSRVGVQAAASAGMRVIAVPHWRNQAFEFPGARRVYASLVEVGVDLEKDGLLK